MPIMKYIAACIAAITFIASPEVSAGDPTSERVEELTASAEASLINDGDCIAVEGDGFNVTSCSDGAVEWCVDDRCGTDWIPTTWGCQYFPEEGPADDLAVCILTQLAIKCCSCLAVCPDDDEGSRPASPTDIAAAIGEDEGSGDCRWGDVAGTDYDCAIQCGDRWLATCTYFESFDATICGSPGGGVTLEGNVCPGEGW